MTTDSFSPMSFPLKLTLGVYIAVLHLGLPTLLGFVWPRKGGELASFGTDAHFLLCAAIAGALGSCIHLGTSFIAHAGNGRLRSEWAWWYFLRPWIGSALAVVVYFVVRAGLIGPAESAVNPNGIAAIAALAGMFSHQATEKLRSVFENICGTDRKVQ